jgi:hypothetical protein
LKALGICYGITWLVDNHITLELKPERIKERQTKINLRRPGGKKTDEQIKIKRRKERSEERRDEEIINKGMKDRNNMG